MTGAAITDGDLVVVRQQPAAENYVTTRDYEAVRTIKIKKSGSLGHPRGGP